MSSLTEATGVILAGGFGTRLRSVLADRPKVLAPVNGRPFLTRLLDQIADVGVRTVVLCTGYLGEQVEQTLGDQYREMRLVYSRETTPLGTGGALRAAAPLCPSDTVLVLNGDSYCDVDLAACWGAHTAAAAEATIVVRTVHDTSRFGRVTIGDNQRIVRFEEKTQSAGEGCINAGIYLLARRLIETAPAGCEVSLERALFPQWLSTGVFAYETAGAFIDIGTPESYRLAEAFFAA